MKKLLFLLFLLPLGVSAQTIKSNNKDLDRAFALAVRIVDTNIHNGILAAGADYGGEWTRDCAINAWNGVSLLRPAVAEKSLWSVTNDRKSIGHQYWDHIIWTIGALNHYKVNGDTAFLRQARNCAATTMLNLEKSQFEKKWGLFKGPSVFNDGIAAYPEPIFDSTNLRDCLKF